MRKGKETVVEAHQQKYTMCSKQIDAEMHVHNTCVYECMKTNTCAILPRMCVLCVRVNSCHYQSLKQSLKCEM